MLNAFVYNEVAVVVRHWFEIDLNDSHLEHGARIELRLLAAEPHRGTESAAQRVVLDQPLWRADLFDRMDSAPGTFDAAHFHPRFFGVEPSRRHWSEEINAAPWTWLRDQLADVAAITGAAGTPLHDPVGEGEQLRLDAPAIVAAAQAYGPAQCSSKQQCHAWTRDVTRAVRRMLDGLARPDLLDRDRVAPWLDRESA
jgi:hypothetical protein